MAKLPGIILIDNEKSELEKIHHAVVDSGLPCLPIQFINDDPDNTSGLDHVNLEHIVPRIIITDLNLIDSSKLDAKTLAPVISDILSKITISGPYSLFFWTKNKELISSVMNTLQERFSEKTNLPFFWDCIDKTRYLDPQFSLKKELLQRFNESTLFEALYDWECRMIAAAGDTINTLYDLTKPTEASQDYIHQHRENLSNVLALIGNETFGKKNASDYPGEAVDTGLIPVLNDHLRDKKTENDKWQNALPRIGKDVEVNTSIKSHLNTFYHISEVSEDFPKTYRGVFVALSDDYCVGKEKESKLCHRLGVKSLKEIIHTEFLSCDYGTRQEREDARKSLIIGFIEISAECDHAQRKTKLNRYLLAALIPESNIDMTYMNGKSVLHEGIYRLPMVIYKDKKYILEVSFKYQIGTKPEFESEHERYSNAWLGQPLFRLRDQILLDLSYKCSQYSSRPGIVRFD